jgi:hypothetical protein
MFSKSSDRTKKDNRSIEERSGCGGSHSRCTREITILREKRRFRSPERLQYVTEEGHQIQRAFAMLQQNEKAQRKMTPVSALAMFVDAGLSRRQYEIIRSTHKHIQMSQEECTKLRESVPYVKLYRYNPKHLYQKLNGYGYNDHRKLWASCGSRYCISSVTQYASLRTPLQ